MTEIPRVRITWASPAHIPYIIEHSEAKGWKNADKVLENQIARGFAWTGFARMPSGWIPGCMWGIQPRSIVGDEAWLWLVTTDLIDHNPFLFVRHSQRALEYTFQYYPKITACVEDKNPKAKRWLQWLGGQISTEIDSQGLRQVVMHQETARRRRRS